MHNARMFALPFPSSLGKGPGDGVRYPRQKASLRYL